MNHRDPYRTVRHAHIKVMKDRTHFDNVTAWADALDILSRAESELRFENDNKYLNQLERSYGRSNRKRRNAA